ncbi:MAG: hypothetical protein WA843_02395 [Candidatus Saccharimonadales bacterium]
MNKAEHREWQELQRNTRGLDPKLRHEQRDDFEARLAQSTKQRTMIVGGVATLMATGLAIAALAGGQSHEKPHAEHGSASNTPEHIQKQP